MDVRRSLLSLFLFYLHFSSQIKFLRKQYGSRLNVFTPVNDLSSLSRSSMVTRTLVAGKKNDVAIAGGQILGDEYSDHVVKVKHSILQTRINLSDTIHLKNRSGIILREGYVVQWYLLCILAHSGSACF